MRKNNLVKACCFLLLLLLVASCEKENETSSSRIEIDCENSSIQGSFVQNTPLSTLEVFSLRYMGENASVKVSAKEVNGIYISEKQIALTKEGIVKIPIEGKPIELGDYTLKLEIDLGNQKLYCSQIITVYEDTDPSAPITLTIAPEYTNITGLISAKDIPFLIDPGMASITIDSIPVGLTGKTLVDKRTGAGILTLTPSDDFVNGKVILISSFGARTPRRDTINVVAFVNGDGSTANPYEINSAALLKKTQKLLNEKFILTTDIDMAGIAWQPLGTVDKPFNGVINGNGKTISNLSITGAANTAFIAYTGTASQINNLTITGSVTGTECVAGLIANNKGKVTGCTATNMIVKGENKLSGLVAENTGTIASSTPTNILKLTDFPAMISDITTTIHKTLNISPTSAVATIESAPENATASITSGNVLNITPGVGFIKSEMTVKVTLGNISTLPRTIHLFAEEQFDDGDGINVPFKISKASQFNKIRDYSDKRFQLTQDIDLNDLGSRWVPIASFSGTIDGGNYQVKNLKLDAIASKGGLITTNTGNIKNLSFPNIDITTAVSFGVLVGDHSVGTIENVVIKGNVKSTNTGDLLGGIAAEITSGTISNVYVNLAMEATCGMVGGIVGRAKTGASTIANCTSEGSIAINAAKNRIGGIVGRGESAITIQNCLSSMSITGIVSGANGVGGIFGANNNNNMRIDECMFTGKITNVFSCGGIAGVAANIRNCVVQGSGANIVSPMITVGGTINTSSAGAIAGTGKLALEYCIARNVALTGVSTVALPLAGIVSTFQNDGYVSKCVVSNVLINATNPHGVAGTGANGSGSNTDNYSSNMMYYEAGSASAYSPTNSATGLDGGTKNSSDLTQAFYQSLGYNFTTIWSWDGTQPVLRNVGYKGSVSATTLSARKRR